MTNVCENASFEKERIKSERRLLRLKDAISIVCRYNLQNRLDDADYHLLYHTLKGELRLAEKEHKRFL